MPFATTVDHLAIRPDIGVDLSDLNVLQTRAQQSWRLINT